MLNLDSYYNVARQNLGAQINLDDNGRLIAVKKVAEQNLAHQTQGGGVSHRYEVDSARRNFYRLLVEKHEPRQGEGRAGLAYAVIDALYRRDTDSLTAAEINSVKRSLGDGRGGETIKWLDSGFTAADRLYTEMDNLSDRMKRGPRENLLVGYAEINKLEQGVTQDMMNLVQAERNLYIRDDKAQASTDYLELYVSLKSQGRVLSKERLCPD